MKHKLKSKRVFIAPALVLIVLVIISLVLTKNWFRKTYYQKQVEHTVSSQIKPLEGVLMSLGFTNLSNLDTKCGNEAYGPQEEEQLHSGGSYFQCSSGIDRFMHVPTDTVGKAKFNEHAAELSQLLEANGWKSRPDYLTIPWFQKISQGVDYQPDQLNTKKVNGFECTVDFFTAYSKMYNEKPAISVRIFCNKQSDPEPPISN